MKGDAWEGGHREPFIAKWPGKVRAGTTSEELICFTDVLATFAALTGAALPAGAGEDSFSFLPALRGEKHARPRARKCCSAGKADPLHPKRRLEIDSVSGSGGFSTPSRIAPRLGEPAGQLYNLADDPTERRTFTPRIPTLSRADRHDGPIARKGPQPPMSGPHRRPFPRAAVNKTGPMRVGTGTQLRACHIRKCSIGERAEMSALGGRQGNPLFHRTPFAGGVP